MRTHKSKEKNQITSDVQMIGRNSYNAAWEKWGDMIDNSPAPRYRRRMILSYIRNVAGNVDTIADIGCGNGALLYELALEYKMQKQMWGVDFSTSAIAENRARASNQNIHWKVLDLENEALEEKYDLIICSEVLEHLADWQSAFGKLLESANQFLLITIPSGPVFPIDKWVGHYRHFTRQMIEDYLRPQYGITARIEFWGFPFHMIYKRLINLQPDMIYHNFAQRTYGGKERFISNMLNILFFLNFKTNWQTNQMFIFITKSL